jgi:SpoIID/LytB domain protein
MIDREPNIHVGIIEREAEIKGKFNGPYELPTTIRLNGAFTARIASGRVVLFDDEGIEVMKASEILCQPLGSATFTLAEVTIGIRFHWERKEHQTFAGALRLIAAPDGTLTAVNDIGVEEYLKSVISSEMSAEAPEELLRAHAITSRSWLVAMLERERRVSASGAPAMRSRESAGEIVRWYDREDHSLFDVCADDHCQRYQGITKIITATASKAIQDTRGSFLVYDDEICDARFYKACGGLTDNFENVWEDTPVPYLRSVADAERHHAPITSEEEARAWVLSSPEAYCNTNDPAILKQILPSFDQETTDFFRWRIEYSPQQLGELIRSKSGIDFGVIRSLTPVLRGPSGRILRLRIEGSARTIVVGKELEIRRWLSKSHLYSSAFVVDVEKDAGGMPSKFILRGGGWGHGVGLCQIGAAVMASKGMKAEKIVLHYFPGARLQRLY